MTQKREPTRGRSHMLNNYIPEPNTGCWLWLGGLDRAGYGRTSRRAHGFKTAHRAFWSAANGAIPSGMFVCHRCDTPACVNPAHLFLGTNQENTADKVRKSRQAHGAATRPETRSRGERQHLAKVSASQVTEMRALAASGTPVGALALRFGINRSSVHRIIRRESWAHV